MYHIIQTAHSYIAYLALALLVAAVVVSFLGLKSTTFKAQDAKIYMYSVIATHTQLVLGLVLLFISPITQAAYANMAATMKDATLRRYAVEHPSVNILAVILVTVASARTKRIKEVSKKYRTGLIFFGLALLLIFSRIPWSAWL